MFWHGGLNASSSRRAISTFTVSRPPYAVAWLIAYALGCRQTTEIQISVLLSHLADSWRRLNGFCLNVRTRGELLYITLAGLIPVPLPLAGCFWIRCSWQILSFSSFAVSSAAAYTASPLLRPFTSTALMAATSLAPHALRIRYSDSHHDIWWESCAVPNVGGGRICFGEA